MMITHRQKSCAAKRMAKKLAKFNWYESTPEQICDHLHQMDSFFETSIEDAMHHDWRCTIKGHNFWELDA